MRGAARLVSAEAAVAAIPSGATLAVGGFVGAGHPELLTQALEQRFLQTKEPCDLTLVYAAGQGDRKERGLNHLAHKGLLKRVIGGHWNLAPKLGKLALDGDIEAYNLPQGVICVLLREIAARRPGVFTKIGLNTFIDPANGGGRLNARTSEPLIERHVIDGETWLRYRSFPIHVAFIRATTADRRGNLSMEREGLVGEVLPIAQAARNHGGIVIAQVERLVDRIEDPKAVRVPGILVDYVVVADEDRHAQTFGEQFNEAYIRARPLIPSLSPDGGEGVQKACLDGGAGNDQSQVGRGVLTAPSAGHDVGFADGGLRTASPTTHRQFILPFSERKIIGRRALMEIRKGDIVNLGIGLPETVAAVAAETGRLSDFTLTVESGPTGGVPASGLSFGCSHFPEAIIDQPAQFDFYDGGGLDIAVLGAVEVDSEGSVSVSSFAGRFAGVGGFVNIAQSARRVVFCCTFRAGDLEVASDAGRLRVVREGKHPKFVKRVQQVCFHGPTALERGQEVIFVTERAVLKLTPAGLELKEVAPGMDLNRDVVAQMEFAPVTKDVREMAVACFEPSAGLKS